MVLMVGGVINSLVSPKFPRGPVWSRWIVFGLRRANVLG